MCNNIKLNKTELIAECLTSDSDEMKMARRLYFNRCVLDCERPGFFGFCTFYAFFFFQINDTSVSVFDGEVDHKALDNVMMELYIDYNAICKGCSKKEIEFLRSRKSGITFECKNLTVKKES